MKTKRRPGPLEVGYYSTTDAFRAIDQHAAVMRPDRSLIAVTGSSTGNGAMEALEYARLFAAAPELLDAIEWLVRDADCDSTSPDDSGRRVVLVDTVERARAAIAKARGA